jgi:lysozyme
MTLNITPKVLDLSHYDKVTDINAVKGAGIIGIVNKATEGVGYKDDTYASRRPLVESAGLKWGAYHFMRPGDPVAQANFFLRVVGDPTGLMLMCDWEVPGVSVDAMKHFNRAVHDKVGRWPVLYSYGAMLLQMLGTKKPDADLALLRLWLAAYNNHPLWPTQIWPVPFLWQFTGDGNGNGPHQIPGISLPGSRGIDVDAYEGGDAHATDHTDAELLAEWADGTAPSVAAVAQPASAPATAAPATPNTSAWQTNITATCFGGAGDAESSAYGGMVNPNVPGVALPFHFPNPRPKVTVIRAGKSAVCEIVDVGPHNTNDPYWLKGARPLAESQSGNHAGIDMTPAAFAALGIGPRDPAYGLTRVDWHFA